MIGTIRINWIVSLAAGIFTFLLSVGNNLFLTTCLRSLYSFLILFILTYAFRFLIGVFGGADFFAPRPADAVDQTAASSNEGHLGSQLDLATPDDDEATRQMLRNNLDNPGQALDDDLIFSPLTPSKLITKNNLNPEQLAGALRRMSED
jgi:energy-coupling factor transporter transmembrane protein EcfT